MGKRYYCDYCDKSMVAAPAIVKTHNNGLLHQKLVQEHYQQFKDPETILAEESNKKPCSRFARGECAFGSICRFSHYSRQELDAIREYVATKNRMEMDITVPSFEDLYLKLQNERAAKPQNTVDGNTVMYDSNGVTHIFPWSYNPVFDGFERLPPSIKIIRVEDFANAKVSEWG